MSFLSANSSFEAYRQQWESTRGLRLTEQLCKVSHFLCRFRVQMRFGELTRAPLKLVRLEMLGDVVECDWIARSLGERIELWDTEWGYSSADYPKAAPSNGHSDEGRGRQASLAVREILTVWAVGFPLAVWYDLRDNGPDPANPEQNFGLLDSSGNEKPAMQAVRNLTTLLNGRKYAGMIRETPPGIHAMRLDGSGDTLAIVWTDQASGGRTVEFTKQDLISASDLFGRAIRWKDRPSDRARVQIDADRGPIYLRWAARSPARTY